jgi:LysR family transcriptional activator of nhaA
MEALLHHRLDVVLTDRAPAAGWTTGSEIRWIGGSALAWCATPALAAQLTGSFPGQLHGAPVVLPAEGLPQRTSVDAWMARHGLAPRVVAECTESALVKTLGAAGLGAFPVPAMVVEDVCRQYGSVVLGHCEQESERYLLVVARRRTPIPGLNHLIEAG